MTRLEEFAERRSRPARRRIPPDRQPVDQASYYPEGMHHALYPVAANALENSVEGSAFERDQDSLRVNVGRTLLFGAEPDLDEGRLAFFRVVEQAADSTGSNVG